MHLPGEFTVTATAAGLSVASGGLKARVSHGSACKAVSFLAGCPTGVRGARQERSQATRKKVRTHTRS